MQSVHKAVLLHEIVYSLKSGTSWYMDCTLGGAGHALAVSQALGGKVNIIGLDQDKKAIEHAREVLENKANKVILECQNFKDMDIVLAKHDITGLDYILFDLGISSDELEFSGKGFSFLKEEPLLMTMGDPVNYTFVAKDIVNKWKEENIADVIYGYGEERFARRIARAIVIYRERKNIETSMELAEIVYMAIPRMIRNRSRIHPATRTFQALRIAVNDELNVLKIGLEKGYRYLNIGGRMAVISFHSLEDRIVKNFYRSLEKSEGTILTKKPITAKPEEIAQNPRSRSAKLRILEKKAQTQI